MKILLLTEGGKKIGFGHLTRCLALYQAFLEKGESPVFLVNKETDVIKFFDSQKVECIYYKNLDPSIADGFDIAVIDSYRLSLKMYQEIRKRVNLGAYIDDYIRIKYPTGIVINGTVYAKNLRYPVNSGVEYLLGPKYIILRKDFWKHTPKKINKTIKNILILFGGVDYYRLTPVILKEVDRVFKGIEINTVMGFGPGNLNEIKNVAKNCKNRIKLVRNPGNLKDLMRKADICISSGGQTLNELAACGTPVVGICVADNQIRHLTSWAQRGFVKYIGWHNNKSLLSRLFQALVSLKDVTVRRHMSAVGKRTVDGLGAKRIIHRLMYKEGEVL